MAHSTEQKSMFIPESGDMFIPRRSFKAFKTLADAMKFIERHSNYECKLRRSRYTQLDERFIVNYKH